MASNSWGLSLLPPCNPSGIIQSLFLVIGEPIVPINIIQILACLVAAGFTIVTSFWSTYLLRCKAFSIKNWKGVNILAAIMIGFPSAITIIVVAVAFRMMFYTQGQEVILAILTLVVSTMSLFLMFWAASGVPFLPERMERE